MRKVKCKICKAEGTDKTFYKVVNNGKNEYYCSEEEYKDYRNKIQLRKNLEIHIAINILSYKEGQLLPHILSKKITELNKFYPMEVIFETFKKSDKTLNYWMNLDGKFNSEYAKVSYMMSIISNNINDVYKEYKINQDRQQKENSQKDIVDMDLLNQTIMTTNKSKIKDISEFLD